MLASRAQLHLRQILDAPGVNALVMPGNEFLLGKAKEAFDQEDRLIDPRTVDFLGSTLASFVKFIKVVSTLALVVKTVTKIKTNYSCNP
ncbi:hypothetical protein EfmAA290_31250 (plasmid) [Enterococcus faecium]|nr:hypothetical protein EfmAA290_31250 [Enterococcus faecium]